MQSIAQARHLHVASATSSEMAEAYGLIESMVKGLDLPDDLKAQELRRLDGLIREYEEDADALLGQIAPELIDEL